MTSFTDVMSSMGLNPYAEQVLMTERLEKDLVDGAISMVEAPPATGKTMVAAWRALSIAQTTGDRTLIAVPTISVLRQTLESVRRMADAGYPKIEVAAIYGRQEFVHRRAAAEWIAAMCPGAQPSYDAWAGAQDESGWTRSSLDEALLEAGYDLDLPIETSILASGASPGDRAYKAQFATTAKVIVATHAFLARDVAARLGRSQDKPKDLQDVVEANERRLSMETAEDRILPQWHHLIVDEAHLLVGGFMLALTTTLSFARLLSILDSMRSTGIPVDGKRLEKLHELVEAMEDEAPAGLRRSVRLDMNDRRHGAIARTVESTIPADLDELEWTERDRDYLRRFADCAALSMRHRRAVSPGLVWSDVRGLLGMSVTPIGMFRQMDYLWRSCRSATLLSATLYAPHDTEGRSEHAIRQLGLPKDRISEHEPFDSDWTRLPVTVHLPESRLAQAMLPSSKDWPAHVASVVEIAAEEAVTGMLVLFTSHQTTDQVEAMLDEPMAGRIMRTDLRGVQNATLRFVEAARAGHRPIWLATGPAWTGLDLPTDTLDTLVVTRLPYGGINPKLHEHLMSTVKTRTTFSDAETEMLKMFQQGIGRLVRDRDPMPRRLWLADGRIVGHSGGARAAALLASYPDQQEYVQD